MQVPDGLDPVGKWYFGSISATPAGTPAGELAAAAAAALSILEPAGLLTPESLRCERWLTGLGKNQEQARFPPLAYSLKDSARDSAVIADAIQRHLDNYSPSNEAYPAELEIRGHGYIATAKERQPQNDLCELRVSYDAGDVIVTVETRSDVWLPFDLKASPQPELAQANGPRLKAALHALADLSGSDPETGSQTKYAVVAPYDLENARDVDEEVIATADW